MYSSVCVFIGAKGTHVCMCVNVCQCASMSQSSHLALLPPVLERMTMASCLALLLLTTKVRENRLSTCAPPLM